MKLRNKKTGRVQTCDFAVISEDHHRDGELLKLESHIFIFRSIKQLNEEYEDYAPAEPLIKDEKIRKAVRAWAEANGVGRATYMEDNYRFFADDTEVGSMIEFENMPEHIGLKHEHHYAIAELCGPSDSEEEE